MKSMKIVLYIVLVLLNIFLFALVVHCAVEHPSPNNYAHDFKYTKATNDNYYSITDCVPGFEKRIEIPASYNNLPVTHIAANALSKCSEAEELFIPDSITVIDQNAFVGCDSLEVIEVDDANGFYDSRYNCNAIIETKTNTLILGCKNTVIPEVVTSIGVGAFSGRKGLVSIELTKNIKKISADAFANCPDLAEFNVTQYITSIEERAFAGCSSLSKLTVDSKNTAYNSNGNCNAIIHTASDSLIAGCRSTVIPSNVRSIGPFAFMGCSQLVEMNVPSSVKIIGENAFAGCSNLKSINLSDEVTTISNNAFKDCVVLERFYLPEATTTLGEKVLYNCPKLEEIVVSNNNEHFDSRNNCNAIINTETNSVIYGCSKTVLPSNVSIIASYAFSYSGITEVVLPENINTVSENAFYNCADLTTVVILNKNIIILSNGFKDCSSIEKLFFKGTVDEWYSNFNIANVGNEWLRDAERYYYSETEPTKEENYWHIVNGEIVIWEEKK